MLFFINLSPLQKFLNRNSRVLLYNFSEQWLFDVLPGMDRNNRPALGRGIEHDKMAALLARFFKPEFLQNSDDFLRTQARQAFHADGWLNRYFDLSLQGSRFTGQNAAFG